MKSKSKSPVKKPRKSKLSVQDKLDAISKDKEKVSKMVDSTFEEAKKAAIEKARNKKVDEKVVGITRKC